MAPHTFVTDVGFVDYLSCAWPTGLKLSAIPLFTGSFLWQGLVGWLVGEIQFMLISSHQSVLSFVFAHQWMRRCFIESSTS